MSHLALTQAFMVPSKLRIIVPPLGRPQRFRVVPNKLSSTRDCHYFYLPRATAVLKIDNTIKWMAAFHCRSRLLGYWVFCHSISNFKFKTMKKFLGSGELRKSVSPTDSDCFYWIAYPPTVSLCGFIINESCILFRALLYYILPGLDWPGGGLTCKWTTIFKNGVAILALLFPFSQFSLCLHRINFDARGRGGEENWVTEAPRKRSTESQYTYKCRGKWNSRLLGTRLITNMQTWLQINNFYAR